MISKDRTIVLILGLLVMGCTVRSPNADKAVETSGTMARPQVGGLYAGRTEAGHYLVYKVLAVDEKGEFLRQYANEFSTIPSKSDLSALRVGEVADFALARGFFFDNSPTLVAVEAVAPEEAESYERYLSNVRR